MLIDVLSRAREGVGVSQRELARRLGLASTAIGRIERHERLVDVIEFVGIARSLGLEPMLVFSEFLGAVEAERIARGQRR